MRKMYWAMAGATALLIASACSDSSTTTQPGMKPASKHAADNAPAPDGKIFQSNVTAGACDETEWHWVITGLANIGASPASITVYINGGTQTVNRSKFTGGTAHYALPASDGDVLNAPYAEATLVVGTFYLRFNLSHGPCDGGGGGVQGSSVVTTVHDAAHGTVTNDSPALLGSTVHDKATVTVTGDAPVVPANSKVTFYFWKNGSCDGTPFAGPSDVSVTAGGATADAHPGLEQGPLGAGAYSYKAFFVSGNSELVADAEGECEPFAISKGTLHISTNVHDASHTPVTNSTVALGSKLHDFATVSGAIAGFDPANSVTFKSYTNKTCTAGEATVANGPAETGGVRSAESGALGAGDYGYQAFLADDNNYTVIDDSHCEPVTVNKGTLRISTNVHDASHTSVTNGSVPLGSKLHDFATVTGAVAGIDPANSVTFKSYTNITCTAGEAAVGSGPAETGGVRSAESVALGAGDYGYQAFLAEDNNYIVIDDSHCEPVTVNKATLHISTNVHNAAHGIITNTTVATGSIVHDFALLTGVVAGFPKANAVTFKFYSNGTCSGDGTAVLNDGADGTGVKSAASSPLGYGAYAFLASLADDANYTVVDDTGCEPFSVNQLGKTMGFWGNTNGIAAVTAAGGYSANAMAIGRSSNIDTQAEALKVFPNTLNACGKVATLVIFNNTSTKDCTLSTGLNMGTLNTNSAQTLALGYNIKLVTNYTGQTIGVLGCSAYITAGLTAGSTVNAAFAAAVGLINGSASGGTTTQGNMGAMNLLLNCLNREA